MQKGADSRMYQPRRRRNTGLLWTLIVIAAIYVLWVRYGYGLTTLPDLEAGAGVLLGLFICSRGAANLLDMVLFGRILQPASPSRRTEAWWVAFNLLILVIGWFVIFVGATHLVQAGALHHVRPPGRR
jgi:hypothetical protein